MKKIIPRDKQRLTYLKWQDAHSNGGWLTSEELNRKIKDEICICEQVGWVVYEDKLEIHLCARRLAWKNETTPQDHEYGLYQRIPKAWIMDKKVFN